MVKCYTIFFDKLAMNCARSHFELVEKVRLVTITL